MLSSLGKLAARDGEYDVAIENLKRAKTIREETLGKGHPAGGPSEDELIASYELKKNEALASSPSTPNAGGMLAFSVANKPQDSAVQVWIWDPHNLTWRPPVMVRPSQAEKIELPRPEGAYVVIRDDAGVEEPVGYIHAGHTSHPPSIDIGDGPVSEVKVRQVNPRPTNDCGCQGSEDWKDAIRQRLYVLVWNVSTSDESRSGYCACGAASFGAIATVSTVILWWLYLWKRRESLRRSGCRRSSRWRCPCGSTCFRSDSRALKVND